MKKIERKIDLGFNTAKRAMGLFLRLIGVVVLARVLIMIMQIL